MSYKIDRRYLTSDEIIKSYGKDWLNESMLLYRLNFDEFISGRLGPINIRIVYDWQNMTYYKVTRDPENVEALLIYSPDGFKKGDVIGCKDTASKIHVAKTESGTLTWCSVGPVADRKSGKKQFHKYDFFIRKQGNQYVGRFSSELRNIHKTKSDTLGFMPPHKMRDFNSNGQLDIFVMNADVLSADELVRENIKMKNVKRDSDTLQLFSEYYNARLRTEVTRLRELLENTLLTGVTSSNASENEQKRYESRIKAIQRLPNISKIKLWSKID